MLLNYLSSSLILTPEFIDHIACSANESYNKFSITKTNGKSRVVYQPQKELKLLQRVLHDDFLKKIIPHPSCTAYRDGASIYKNAYLHKENKYLLRLDFVDFFKSITSNDIFLYLRDNSKTFHSDWTEEDSELFLKIVCYKGRLTMGSVTAPAVSNLVCWHLDEKISELCSVKGVTYSRYSDDMYFSTNKENVLLSITSSIINIIRSIEYPKHLIINSSKTKHSSKKRKMSVTGLTLTNDNKISLGRDKKREIRSLVYKWNDLDIGKKKYLQGYLCYCASVEPTFINSLCIKFGSAIISQIQKYIP
ncbi:MULTISPECIES: retron St85 family RNA-directed DNA polymerase [Lelliottia]|uniref:Retron St85 family RNA-directed DNA polymerase n=1 Tax=Lelliottia wanjuensis TaxID=3050585 RepID=A0AAP4D0A2_9ENTR|nr:MULTISPECIES: retron St85 family RNA-directed DNA polymerase [unclassified Lelliottia]MDK9361613.1 retron St85 family RNA-directed DNA polymerase [Lelliottia sp. V106_12]MDK9619719.1 retron St85 family RNA-directed DNA polymerase [Lelliottia sp. V106_9]